MFVFDSSYLTFYELSGHYSPDTGNCKTKGETLLLSNSHQDFHRWVVVVAAAAVAAVDSLFGSNLLSYRQIHLNYIAGKKKKKVKLNQCNNYSR